MFPVSNILALLLIIMVNAGKSGAIDCSLEAVSNRLAKCVTLTLTDANSLQQAISSMCKSVECTIACYERAVGDCSAQGIFRLYDFDAYRVGTRYACNYDITEMINAATNCVSILATSACFLDAVTDLGTAASSLLSTPDYDAYVTAYCSYASSFKSCLKSSPLVSSGSCTPVQAELMNNLYDISLSVASCNIAQDNPLFSTYGGEATCGAGDLVQEKGLRLFITLCVSFAVALTK